MAISITGLNDAFISTMDKLAAQNLADRNPGFLIKFFFFDHPPLKSALNWRALNYSLKTRGRVSFFLANLIGKKMRTVPWFFEPGDFYWNFFWFSGRITVIMATKEEVIEAFLKCFRVSLNYILLYSKEHKSFLKSITELHEKTTALFSYLNPIEILFYARQSFYWGEIYSKINLYKELAALFHQRKVQSLRLIPGISEEELGVLLEKLALAPKEIIKSGGLAVILSKTAENPIF